MFKQQVRRVVSAAKNAGPKLAAGVTTMALTGLAMAQTTDPFNDAVTDMTTKVTGYGGKLVVLAAVGVGFGVAIKYIRKIRSAA